MRYLRWLIVALIVAPQPVSAAVTLLVHEATGFESELSGAGHAAIYLSNVCSDDSITLRLCRPGEEGVVVSTYGELLVGDSPYWLATPLSRYLFGSSRLQDQPIYATKAIREFLRTRHGRAHPMLAGRGFSGAGQMMGSWPLLVGNALERTVYGLQLDTTREQDIKVIDALHQVQGRRVFDISYNNCSDFSRFVLNTYFPGAVHRDLVNDFTFTTPKAIAVTLTSFGRRHPQLGFTVTRYRQIEGPMARSRPARRLSEKFLSSRKYVALLSFFQPFSMTVLNTLNLASGPFDLERIYQDGLIKGQSQPIATAAALLESGNGESEHHAVTPSARVMTAARWKSHRTNIDELAREAVERGLFRNRAAVKRFAVDVQSVSAPEFGPGGDLRLRVGVGFESRFIGLTDAGIQSPATDPRLAYQLLLSLAVRELDRKEGYRPTLDELDGQWQRLRTLRQHPEIWTPASGPLVCPADTSCVAPARASLWKRILAFISR